MGRDALIKTFFVLIIPSLLILDEVSAKTDSQSDTVLNYTP